MSSIKNEFIQEEVFMECEKCPDRFFDPSKNGGHICRKSDRKIDVDPFKDTPLWCPRFPL